MGNHASQEWTKLEKRGEEYRPLPSEATSSVTRVPSIPSPMPSLFLVHSSSSEMRWPAESIKVGVDSSFEAVSPHQA